MTRFLFLLLLAFSTQAYGQYDMNDATKDTTEKEQKLDKMALKERIYVGGDLSVTFGQSFYLMLQPMVGYDIWKGISAGPTLMYQYQRFPFGNTVLNYHAYGGGVFARWRPPSFEYLLTQLQFDLYNTDDLGSPVVGARTTVPAFYAGLGYAGGFGRAYYQIMLYWDFIDDPSNPLPSIFSLPTVGALPLYLRYGMVFYLG